MTLNHINLAVKDPEAGKSFYTRWFGFAEVLRTPTFLKLRDEAGFELSLTAFPDAAVYPSCFHFGFRLDSPDRVRTFLNDIKRERIPVHSDIYESEDRVYFTCLDPDGHKIEIYWE